MLSKLCWFSLLVWPLFAQTDVYVRASGPQPQTIVGATNATPVVLTTLNPHGFSASCNTTTNKCYCAPTGVPMGTGMSSINAQHLCVYVDPTHLSIYDLAGTPVAGNGNWFPGYTDYPNVNPNAQWVGALTKYTIPANPGPLGYLDGTNGDLTRRVSLLPSSITVAGCPGACVVTVVAGYNPTAGKFPVAAGQHFSVTGTGTSLDTCGDGTASPGAQSPYTVASASSSGWVSNSFACAISNGDYSNINNHCGPPSTPNDTIGGTQPCMRVSQMAWVGNPFWDNLKTRMVAENIVSSPNFKTTFDGGQKAPAPGLMAIFAMAGIRSLVDPTNQLWVDIGIYALNHDERSSGVGYGYNTAVSTNASNWSYVYTTDMEGLTILKGVMEPYWRASEKAAFLDRMYNDVDVAGSASITTNQDAANQSTHNWVLSSGLLAAGTNDSTHAQLPNTDLHFSTVDYYKNTVIKLDNGGTNDYDHASYGLITAQSGAGVLTVAGWTAGNGGAGTPPARNNVAGGTYTSGLACTGTAGQTVSLDLAGGARVTLPLTGTNAIASGTAFTVSVPGSGYLSAPTAGTANIYNGSVSYTCTGTATVATVIGTPYTIFDTISTSSRTAGGVATVTFTKTASLAGSINVGDAIEGYNGWANPVVGNASALSYVSSVGSNTLSVINGSAITASATPSMAWRIPQWTAGDVGRLNASKRMLDNSMGVQAVTYGPGVSSQIDLATGFIYDSFANGGGGASTAWMGFELATAPDDSRAVRDLTRTQGYMFDYGVRPLIDFSTGRLRDGSGYSMDGDGPSGDLFVWGLTQSLPAYPLLDVTGPWAQKQAIWNIFETLPDHQGGQAWLMGWAGFGNQLYPMGRTAVTSYGMVLDATSQFAPVSNNAAWFRNWQENIDPVGGSLWGYTEDDRIAIAFLHNDPRVRSTDYKVQPTQHAFNVSSSASVTSLTGWPIQYRGDAVISRTGWSSANDTLSLFDSATFTSGVYDSPRVGQVLIWKTGCLLTGVDSNPCNGAWIRDTSTVGDTFGFNGAGIHQFNLGIPPTSYTPLTRWASATAGSYGTQYGDASNRFAHACTEAKSNYNQSYLALSIDHVQICWTDFKKPGNDQFLFQYHDASLTSGTAAMAWHLQYPQNGQTQQGGPVGGMPTGSTTYMGSNVIKSLEDGGGVVPRTHGLMTYVTSPGTITLHDDCVGHGGGQCAPGDTYVGGNGYSHRFTVAGGAAVGAAVSSFVSVVVHKVMSSLTDTTLTTVDLNPDANWTGVQASGAVSAAVFLAARGGVTHATITGFTTTHSGTAQYLISGLTAGAYNVTVDGSPVLTGARVNSGDNSLYFESTAGAVAISQSGVPPSITTLSLPASTAGVAYSQTLAATGGASPYTWSVSSGSLPLNLSLNASTGVIGGTPDTGATNSFTVTVTGADTLSASAPLSIVINPALSVTTTTLPAGTLSRAYSQTLAASGGTGAHTWSITAGALPGGLQCNTNTGVISGAPTAAGAFNFTVRATDAMGASGSKALSIAVLRPAGTTVHGATLRGVTGH